MPTWFKDEATGQLLNRRKLHILLTRREFAIIRTYCKDKERTFDEGLLDALEMGIEGIADAGHDPAQPGRKRILAFILALGLGAAGLAYAKPTAPEPLTKAWAEKIERRLAIVEDQVDGLEAAVDEVMY